MKRTRESGAENSHNSKLTSYEHTQVPAQPQTTHQQQRSSITPPVVVPTSQQYSRTPAYPGTAAPPASNGVTLPPMNTPGGVPTPQSASPSPVMPAAATPSATPTPVLVQSPAQTPTPAPSTQAPAPTPAHVQSVHTPATAHNSAYTSNAASVSTSAASSPSPAVATRNTSSGTPATPSTPATPATPVAAHASAAAFIDPLLDQDISQDKEVFQLLNREQERQAQWLNLIASENYAPKAVMQAEGSIMMNKYSEGYPGMRHYGGNEAIDSMEQLCQERALQLYELDSNKWGVNVQSLAGTQANSQVYHALMKPHERLMGLSLTHGGHMSFGYQTDKLKVSCVSAYYDTLPYEVDLASGRIDYDDLEKLAKRFRPKVIVAGASSYCRLINYHRLKSICSSVGAYLVVDMAHIAGQIAAKLLPSPFEYADVVTTAAQKTLRGPRGAIIFYKKELEGPINFSVFPASQGGPHNHTITALAVALGQANTRDFREYQRRLMSNAKSLEMALIKRGFSLVSGGTDIHMIVVSLVDKGIDGARVNAACERSHIALSATAVPGDKWALPRAVRIGTTPMTTRGFSEQDFVRVVDLLDKIISISVRVQAALPESANKLRDFKAALSARPEFDDINREVSEWVTNLPLPKSW